MIQYVIILFSGLIWWGV